MLRLLISQQRRPLAVFADNLSTWEGIATQKARHTDSQGKQEEHASDGEGEDPLQLQDGQLAQELANTGGCITLASALFDQSRGEREDLQNDSTDSANPMV